MENSRVYWKDLIFDTSDSEVYPPKPQTFLLAERAIPLVHQGNRVLEMCSGNGVVAIAIAKYSQVAEVVASDISAAATQTIALNNTLNGTNVSIVRSDLFQSFHDQRFDLIIAHPPAIPYQSHTGYGMTEGMRTATDGGVKGTSLSLAIVAQSKEYLSEGGKLLLLLPHWSASFQVIQALKENYAVVKTLESIPIDFFPLQSGKPRTEEMEYLKNLSSTGEIELEFRDGHAFSHASVVLASEPSH